MVGSRRYVLDVLETLFLEQVSRRAYREHMVRVRTHPVERVTPVYDDRATAGPQHAPHLTRERLFVLDGEQDITGQHHVKGVCGLVTPLFELQVASNDLDILEPFSER